jgi:hypothetical protein
MIQRSSARKSRIMDRERAELTVRRLEELGVVSWTE